MEAYPPADSIAGLEDGDLGAILDQDVGASKACKTCTDDGYIWAFAHRGVFPTKGASIVVAVGVYLTALIFLQSSRSLGFLASAISDNHRQTNI